MSQDFCIRGMTNVKAATGKKKTKYSDEILFYCWENIIFLGIRFIFSLCMLYSHRAGIYTNWLNCKDLFVDHDDLKGT